MANTSWRHHYIPQFYLNGFTSDNGSFKIYDVSKDRFLKNGKDFYPESFFYEIDGNTVISDDKKYDFIESSYQRLDDRTAEIFNRLNKSCPQDKFNLVERDIAALQYFIGIMYWRIPRNHEMIKEIIVIRRLKDLGLKVLDKNSEIVFDESIENEVKNNPNFIKAMKFLFPTFTYPETFNCKTPSHIIRLLKGGPSVCSDNPIICKNPDTFNVYTDDLIFPLNDTKLFIRGDSLKEFSNLIKIEIDTLVYKQAIKYVSCTDESYLSTLDEFYEKHFGTIDKLRDSIFGKILNYTA